MQRHRMRKVLSIIMAGIVLFSIGWRICLKNNSKNMTQQQLPQKWHLNGLSKNGLSNDTQTILKNGQKYERLGYRDHHCSCCCFNTSVRVLLPTSSPNVSENTHANFNYLIKLNYHGTFFWCLGANYWIAHFDFLT